MSSDSPHVYTSAPAGRAPNTFHSEIFLVASATCCFFVNSALVELDTVLFERGTSRYGTRSVEPSAVSTMSPETS